MAGIGSLFGGLAQGLQAGIGLAQRQQQLQMNQQTIDLEKQRQDITLQQIQGAMNDSKALTAAMSVGIREQKAQADALGMADTLGNLAAMKPGERSKLAATAFAGMEQKTGKQFPQVVKDFFNTASPETLQPLVASMTQDIAKNGPENSIALLSDPVRFTAATARLASRNAQTADQAALVPAEQSALDVSIGQQQYAIQVLQKRLDAVLQSGSSYTTESGAKQFVAAVDKLNADIIQRQGQLNTLVAKKSEIQGYAPGSALYQDGQQIGSVPAKPDTRSEARMAQERELIDLRARAQGTAAQARMDVADQTESNLTPEALDLAAERYRIDGTLTGMGRGGRGAANTAAVIDRAANTALADGNTAEETALRQLANVNLKRADAEMRKQQVKISAFERTAVKNADLALAASEKLDRLNVPFIDKLWISTQKQASDNPDIAEVQLYTLGFRNEFARIVTGATGVTSDTARREVDDVLKAYMGKMSFAAAINAAKTEMRNRIAGFEEEHASVMERIADRGGTGDGKPKAKPKGEGGKVKWEDL